MRHALAVVPLALAAASPAFAFNFTLTPVTLTTPNFAGPILITGSVTVAPGEFFYSPTVMSATYLPFLPTFAAGFNGSGQNWDPGFLAWNGVGTYTGPIYNHMVSANNLGYAGGMPAGLYGSNPLGPGGLSALRVNYIGLDGNEAASVQSYAVRVVPAPGACALAGLGGAWLATRRRRGTYDRA